MKLWGAALAVGFALIGTQVFVGLMPQRLRGEEPKALASPGFDEQAKWLNSSPKTISDIRGHVALVVFWTLGCCYCTNTLPYVKSWHERYAEKGLNVIGVHSPEFAYYADEQLVRDLLNKEQLGFPVVLDHQLRTWERFRCRSWPSICLFDRGGRLRCRFDSPIDAAAVESEIQHLLSE